MLRRLLSRLFDRKELSQGPISDTRSSGPASAPRLLVLSSAKRNQNFYRDLELAKQTRSLLLGEDFNWDAWDHDVARMAAEHFAGGAPDAIFLNYNHHYTHRLKGIDALGVPVLGFVGDHYDFTDDVPRALVKQEFFRQLTNLVALVSAYPHTNDIVAQALGRPALPFIYLPWAVDAAVFRDLGQRRRYDIACLGALTDGKYPFRRQVRTWIESQKRLSYIRKKRIGGHDGEQFNRALNTTRSAFTCASALDYTLMKYFEIPASGALLFGEKTAALTALGFIDGEHYVAVEPTHFHESFEHFLLGDGRQAAERIRQAGNIFVRTEHTWEKRIGAFVPDIQRVLRA